MTKFERRGERGGPAVVVIRDGEVIDCSAHFATLSLLLDHDQPLQAVREISGTSLGSIEDLLANSGEQRDPAKPYLLAPTDLQVIKAAGVTFASSMIERVIEEKAGGDALRAEEIRALVQAAIGDNLRDLKPGSPEAMRLKQVLIEQKMWSQYLEVGIGPDAEIFTKAHEALLSLALLSSSALRPSKSRRLTSLPNVAPWMRPWLSTASTTSGSGLFQLEPGWMPIALPLPTAANIGALVKISASGPMPTSRYAGQ